MAGRATTSKASSKSRGSIYSGSAQRSQLQRIRAIEDALREAHPDHLEDDATLIVLAPSGMIGAAG